MATTFLNAVVAAAFLSIVLPRALLRIGRRVELGDTANGALEYTFFAAFYLLKL